MAITFRQLPVAEWDKLRAFSPFDQGLPNPDHWRVIVAEEDGAIVGHCSLFDTVHWDAFYVHPDHRGKATVFGGLIREGLQMLEEAGVHLVHSTVSNSRPDMQALLERFGYTPAEGKLYLLYVPNAMAVR